MLLMCAVDPQHCKRWNHYKTNTNWLSWPPWGVPCRPLGPPRALSYRPWTLPKRGPILDPFLDHVFVGFGRPNGTQKVIKIRRLNFNCPSIFLAIHCLRTASRLNRGGPGERKRRGWGMGKAISRAQSGRLWSLFCCHVGLSRAIAPRHGTARKG